MNSASEFKHHKGTGHILWQAAALGAFEQLAQTHGPVVIASELAGWIRKVIEERLKGESVDECSEDSTPAQALSEPQFAYLAQLYQASLLLEEAADLLDDAGSEFSWHQDSHLPPSTDNSPTSFFSN